MKSLPLIFTLGAAASIHSNAVAQQKLAALCAEGVKVFYAPSRVGKEYQQVTWLEARDESGYNSEDMIIKIQRRKAARLGANGIIVGGFQELQPGGSIGNAGVSKASSALVPERGAVLAIYIPADSDRVKAKCKGTHDR